MDKLKELQEKYKKGGITKGQYVAALAKLVEEKVITQDEMDDAIDYNPEADKPIYTQTDVDGMIARKATQQLRKILKDAGVEVDASNKDLSTKVVELVQIGQGKIKPAEGQEVENLKAQAAKAGTLAGELKTLRLENVLLKTFAKPGYNPVSQSAVVALLKSDYAHMIDYLDEETGEIEPKSVEKAVRKLQMDEPTLFKTDDGNGGNGDEGKNFRGKGPGGTGGASTGDKGHDANKRRALEMMGLAKKDETTK